MKRARIETATGMLGLQDLKWNADQAARRISAEDQASHKQLWGTDMPPGDEMGDINLGDSYSYQNAPQSTFSKLAGQALIAAAVLGPLAFVASKYLDRPVAEAADTDNVTRLKIVRDGE